MAEETKTEEKTPEQKADEALQPSFQLVRCFFKDASLEMPHAPDIFLEEHNEQPACDFKFGVAARALSVKDLFEVVLRATITVGFKEKTMFLVEGTQSGVFEFKNIPEEAMAHVTNVVCPALLLPYLRANMADLINRTGLPTVNLPEVNFEALMQQRIAEMQAAKEKQAPTAQA